MGQFMKKIILICLLTFVFSCSEERDSRLIGTWFNVEGPPELPIYIEYQFSEEGQVMHTKKDFYNYQEAIYGRWKTEDDHNKLYITWDGGATGEQLMEYSVSGKIIYLREIVDFRKPKRESKTFVRKDD